MIQRYVSKISGPLLDRIDIHIEVPAVKYKELRAPASSEDSATVRARVIALVSGNWKDSRREKDLLQRADGAEDDPQTLRDIARRGKAAGACGDQAGLSARAHDRILKVSRTIADLDGAANIEAKHLSEASNIARWIAAIGRNIARRPEGNSG